MLLPNTVWLSATQEKVCKCIFIRYLLNGNSFKFGFCDNTCNYILNFHSTTIVHLPMIEVFLGEATASKNHISLHWIAIISLMPPDSILHFLHGARTILHKAIYDRKIWHRGQFGTGLSGPDNLALRTIRQQII